MWVILIYLLDIYSHGLSSYHSMDTLCDSWGGLAFPRYCWPLAKGATCKSRWLVFTPHSLSLNLAFTCYLLSMVLRMKICYSVVFELHYLPHQWLSWNLAFAHCSLSLVLWIRTCFGDSFAALYAPWHSNWFFLYLPVAAAHLLVPQELAMVTSLLWLWHCPLHHAYSEYFLVSLFCVCFYCSWVFLGLSSALYPTHMWLDLLLCLCWHYGAHYG